MLDDKFSGNFLKEALRKADVKMPYRGPEYYQSGEYTYKCKVSGDVNWFQGYEEIIIYLVAIIISKGVQHAFCRRKRNFVREERNKYL